MSKHTTEIVNPVKLYYGDKEFTIGSLGLEPTYALAMYRVVTFRRPNGVLDDISFNEIMSIRTVGVKKAWTITKALSKFGVEVKDIPEITEPTRLTDYRGVDCKCSNCDAVLPYTFDCDDRPFNYCPMCGKKLKW